MRQKSTVIQLRIKRFQGWFPDFQTFPDILYLFIAFNEYDHDISRYFQIFPGVQTSNAMGLIFRPTRNGTVALRRGNSW
jgi:hypothetical protein